MRALRTAGRATLVAGGACSTGGPAFAHGETMPAPELPGVLLAWRASSSCHLAGWRPPLAYLWAVRQVTRRHRSNPPPAWRTAAFLGGMAAIVVALCSPIEAYEGQLFSVHMVQHMLLELVAAPLILLGAPVTLTLRVASPACGAAC